MRFCLFLCKYQFCWFWHPFFNVMISERGTLAQLLKGEAILIGYCNQKKQWPSQMVFREGVMDFLILSNQET